MYVMQHLSDKTIKFLVWILLILALYFLGSAFYLPAGAMSELNASEAKTLSIRYDRDAGVLPGLVEYTLRVSLAVYYAAITKEMDAGIRGQAKAAV